MDLIHKTTHFFNQRQYLLYLLLFVITVSLFTYLQFDPTFADPDSFYHAKMALILNERGAITEFPWLSATTLKYNFVDHHFLYHLILIPFVELFPPLIGLKIATILFASLAILVIFWFLRQLNIKGAFWYVLFLLTVNPFIFRLNLAKAQALVLILFFLFITLLFTRRYLALILASCFFVWLYGGWPLVLLLTFVYGVINYFWPTQKRGWVATKLGKIRIFGQSLLLLISVGLGALAGLFFNPYFVKNFQFYWQQSFKIAILNYQYLIGVGGEWYPYQPLNLFLGALPFFLILIFAIAIFIIYFKKQTANSWFFLVLSLFFLVLTLKSRRYVEYFIPVAFCFSALSINIFLILIEDKLVKLMPKKIILLIPPIILLALSPIFIRDWGLIKNSFTSGFSFTKFAEASEWLKDNSEEGDIVFHTDWDEFPLLFYHNDKNYYLVGLDPTFMYEYDKDLYKRWADIVTGQTSKNLYPVVKDIFGAKYVFVDVKQNATFDQNLANNFYFKKVFENEEAKVYQVND